MKNIIIILIFSVSSIFLTNCLGDENPEIYTLTGTLYENCTFTPAANVNLVLWGYDGSVFQEDVTGVKGSATTDENGNFSISYEKQPIRVDLSLETSNGINSLKVMKGIPNNENLELRNVFISNRGKLKITLDVINTYNSSDTLFISTSGKTTAFNGPFNSGILDTIENIIASPQAFDKDLFYRQRTNEVVQLIWGINRLVQNVKKIPYYPTGCGVIDEITLKIE